MAKKTIDRLASKPKHQCDICKRLFKTMQGLHGHKRMVHGVPVIRRPEPEELVERMEKAIGELGATIVKKIDDLRGDLQKTNSALSEMAMADAYIYGELARMNRLTEFPKD